MRVLLSWLKSFAFSRYVVFLSVLLAYTWFMQERGGLPALLPAWRLEIPLLVYAYFCLNLITRKSKLQPLVTAMPIFLAYGVFDIYFMQLGRLPRIAEVTELPELFRVLSTGNKVLAGFALAVPLLGILACLHLRRASAFAMGSLPLLALVAVVEFFPDAFMRDFQKTQNEIVFFSDRYSVANNGRISMMLYNEARRISCREKTASYRGSSLYLDEFTKMVSAVLGERTKRNIHMVVLESFLDPHLLRGARFSHDPEHPSFKELFKGKEGFSVSPVFAGGTAQAEFEVLCGVPAMRELSGIEFDVFTGAKTLCLPNLLAQGGYQTMATNSFLPDFFNSTNAYAGLGFEKTYYPREYAQGRETYLSTGDMTDEDFMFDGVLFSQNLDFVAQRIAESPGTPIFNYLISIYGHSYHAINYDKRPKVIEMLGDYKDDQLERVANQYYYRTEAIAEFVHGLQRIDPTSLVILVSDHLPGLGSGAETYQSLDYLDGAEDAIHVNRIFFVENGKPVKYSTIHHYDVPQIVLNYVTKGKYCGTHACNFAVNNTPIAKDAYRDEYMTIMAQAMDGKPTAPAEGNPGAP